MRARLLPLALVVAVAGCSRTRAVDLDEPVAHFVEVRNDVQIDHLVRVAPARAGTPVTAAQVILTDADGSAEIEITATHAHVTVGPDQQQPMNEAAKVGPNTPPNTPVGQIVKVTGGVDLGQHTLRPATLEERLAGGDTVIAAKGASAIVEIDDTHARFDVDGDQKVTVSQTAAWTSWLPHVIDRVVDNGVVKWLLLVFLFVMPLASILTWMERRQSAMMQDRLGPNRANIGPIKLKGILHFVADALKMIFKEDFIPGNVHRGLFALAPILALAPVLIAFAIIPFGPTIYPHALGATIRTGVVSTVNLADPIRLQIFQVDFGLIFYFAVLTLANYGGTLAGWASYNKWALLGGLRSSSQMMSYEVTMGLSLMGVFLVCGSLEPGFITATGWNPHWQASNPFNWLWLVQLPALLLFFTAAIAETKRAPFDIPEGEPEIIGYFVEYSGIRWGMFFLAEFIEIVFISAVITTVFFGGWQVPFLDSDGFRAFGSYLPLPHLAVAALQLGAFGAKVVLLCWFQLLIRWTLPRFRADQLMNLGWKWLLPMSIGWTLVTALLVLVL